MVRLLRDRSTRLEGGTNELTHVHALWPKLELVANDSPDVHQVIEQPRHHFTIAVDDVADARDFRITGKAAFENVDARPDGSQRISQLVRKRHQEVIFPPVRLRKCLLV